MTVTVRQIAQSIPNEYLPVALTNPTEIAIQASTGLAGWWTNNQATMTGIVQALPYSWADRLNGTLLTPAISGQNPNTQAGPPNFAGFGYGNGVGTTTALKQFTNTLAAAVVHVGGSGYAVNDTVTLADGGTTKTVLTVTQVTAGAIVAFTISTYGVYSGSPSANPVAQYSTSGSGSGATFDLDVGTANGSLLTASNIITNQANPVSMIVAARIPVVNGYGGGTPGGAMLGTAVNQTQYNDAGSPANVRWMGLGIGVNTNPGRLICCLGGSNNEILGPTGTNYQDGNYHIHMFGCTPSSGSTTPALWVDGIQLETSSLPHLTLNTATGSQQIRIGAVGSPTATPNWGLAGDVGDAFVYNGVDLTLSANTVQRQQVINYLLAKYGIGGTSN